MEENLDSIKENINNDEESLKQDSLKINVEKNQSNTIKNNSPNIDEDPNKKLKNNELRNEKLTAENKNDLTTKPKKEIPIEKKPFNEFINDYLFPSLILEFKERGFEVKELNLKNTIRPIAGDNCWVVYCEVKDTCNFWLSFEKDDISSPKSISLCRSSNKPSVIESFLIDEKRITLKLIISRILQRLNGQKIIGIN